MWGSFVGLLSVVRGCCYPELYCSREGAQFCPDCGARIEFPETGTLSEKEADTLLEQNGQFGHRRARLVAIFTQWYPRSWKPIFPVADYVAYVAGHNKWGMDCPEVRFLMDALARCPQLFGPCREDGVQLLAWWDHMGSYRD